ncbi:cupin domain-containing protein [Erythrobacter sp. 3-20A1M]|uniref:cupin domain-containing protein n=1 Tax=Erythrobacter sp. 3-20A1M TaxID=2653850 RepID=UPI001BFC1483|nr:cupin domain-containing protein [Erythrobacter sp. 3-20A1M]QWC56134.1 cupin domain-containing protein [Erythrobacter sp. 3-20A1M]
MNVPAFRDFDAERFLIEHWQKRPLLIRNPWRSWRNPLPPDELAGLACEGEVESRLVHETASGELDLEHGPLSPTRFGELGRYPWTLLVQAVDHHVPAVAALLDAFRFIPNWRVDDVMVSYAVDGGGVGAHFDRYDVFLVQGLSRRRWRIGPQCDEATPLQPHDYLRLLAEFEHTAEWVLEPGDILYVPPGFAHEGVAVGDDCMTYSVGFRAPSRGELLSGWIDHALDTLAEDDRYTDPDLSMQDNPGEISSAALDRVYEMMTRSLSDRPAFARWFGEYATAPKTDRLDWAPEGAVSMQDVRSAMESGATIMRNPASRFAFVCHEAGSVTLFVDGVAQECAGAAADFAERLCAEPSIVPGTDMAACQSVVNLIQELIHRGGVAFSEDD